VSSTGPKRRFQLVLLKPSHYDDDGYVVQWVRAYVPSNTLAVLYTLGRDAARRCVLGPDTAIDITAIDEINSHIDIEKLLAQFRHHGGFGLVALAGVQSNQFPRALDIARQFRAAGVPVIIGGFHVSGVLAMLPELTPELKATQDMGISMFAGELEGRMDPLLQDAASGTMRPIYNYLKDLPSLESEPTPILPIAHLRRTIQRLGAFDAGRGCPFQCSFCTIINVQGRKSRRRSARDVEQTIREHWAQGVTNFFITDDNFGRNSGWEEIFDRIIEMRERDNMNIKLMIQVDTLCHKIPNFIEKAVRAGTNRALIGVESINAANLLAASKRQNKITEYRKMLQAWKKAGTITVAGYILGFPFDTPDSIREDLKIIQKELPLDFLEFFCLTPLPGSQDHQTLYQKGEWMHPDLNCYDGEHAATHHPKMTGEEWEGIYHSAWTTFYTREHMETIIRRAAATKCSRSRLIGLLFLSRTSVPVEKAHPLQGGVLRRKRRLDRRPGFPIEPIWAFYPKYAWSMAKNSLYELRLLLWLVITVQRIYNDKNRYAYTDAALTAATDDETETLELFTHSDAARQSVKHARKIAELTGGARNQVTAA
jgi:Radical SAM superfamily